jgi:hypothetical protein
MVGGPGFEPGASRSRTVLWAMTLPTNPDVMGRRGRGRLAKDRTAGTDEAKMR